MGTQPGLHLKGLALKVKNFLFIYFLEKHPFSSEHAFTNAG